MNQLIVNHEKCVGCGKCQERCGYKKVISVTAGKASFKKDRSECLECYHCLMVCPNDAISNNGDNLIVSRVSEDTSCVLTRHSCRVYKDKKVEEEVLNNLIRDANLAPRAYIDFRERKYLVVTGEKLKELRAFLLKRIDNHARLFRTMLQIPFLLKATRVNLRNLAWCFTVTTEANKEKEQLFQGAPAVVLICGPEKNVVSKVNSDFALMQLMILAEEQGLGTCVSGYIDGYSKDIGKFLGLPKNEKIFGGAMIGYPAATFTKYVRRNDTSIYWL